MAFLALRHARLIMGFVYIGFVLIIVPIPAHRYSVLLCMFKR